MRAPPWRTQPQSGQHGSVSQRSCRVVSTAESMMVSHNKVKTVSSGLSALLEVLPPVPRDSPGDASRRDGASSVVPFRAVVSGTPERRDADLRWLLGRARATGRWESRRGGGLQTAHCRTRFGCGRVVANGAGRTIATRCIVNSVSFPRDRKLPSRSVSNGRLAGKYTIPFPLGVDRCSTRKVASRERIVHVRH